MGPAPVGEAGAGEVLTVSSEGCSSVVTKHERIEKFKSLNRSIAETTRLLTELVRARIDAKGRVSSDLIARIVIDYAYVGVSFVDYPDDFMDLVEWRRR
jgi:hypothetical protein